MVEGAVVPTEVVDGAVVVGLVVLVGFAAWAPTAVVELCCTWAAVDAAAVVEMTNAVATDIVAVTAAAAIRAVIEDVVFMGLPFPVPPDGGVIRRPD